MTTTKSLRPAAAAALLSALLAACGGGGGDSGSDTVTVPTGDRVVAASTASDVDATNAVDLGAMAAQAISGGNGSSLFGIAGAPGGAAAQAASGRVPGLAQLQAHWIRAATMRLHAPAGRMQAQVLGDPVDAGCYSGIGTVQWNDADNDNRPSRGDTITLSASNCVLAPGLPAANGGFTISINAAQLSGDTLEGLDANVVFNAFSLSGYGEMDGSARLWLKGTDTNATMRLSYQGLSFANAVYQFDAAITISGSTSSFTLSGGIVVDGATYSIVPVTVFVSTDGYPPASGALELRDAAGDRLVVTARSQSTYDLGLYATGSSTATFTQTGLPWVPNT